MVLFMASAARALRAWCDLSAAALGEWCDPWVWLLPGRGALSVIVVARDCWCCLTGWLLDGRVARSSGSAGPPRCRSARRDPLSGGGWHCWAPGVWCSMRRGGGGGVGRGLSGLAENFARRPRRMCANFFRRRIWATQVYTWAPMAYGCIYIVRMCYAYRWLTVDGALSCDGCGFVLLVLTFRVAGLLCANGADDWERLCCLPPMVLGLLVLTDAMAAIARGCLVLPFDLAADRRIWCWFV